MKEIRKDAVGFKNWKKHKNEFTILNNINPTPLSRISHHNGIRGHHMKVAIVMGSISDMPVMQDAIDILKEFGIETEVDIVSAHRTPEKLFDFSNNAHKRGIAVIIAGAGGAAHLPGMVASMSPLPVIGVPVKSSNSIDGWDSVLSILQMPGGVPVATVALNGAKNAGLLATQILGAQNPTFLEKMIVYKEGLKQAVLTAASTLKK